MEPDRSPSSASAAVPVSVTVWPWSKLDPSAGESMLTVGAVLTELTVRGICAEPLLPPLSVADAVIV